MADNFISISEADLTKLSVEVNHLDKCFTIRHEKLPCYLRFENVSCQYRTKYTLDIYLDQDQREFVRKLSRKFSQSTGKGVVMTVFPFDSERNIFDRSRPKFTCKLNERSDSKPDIFHANIILDPKFLFRDLNDKRRHIVRPLIYSVNPDK
jgi:hypothetical protein